MKIKITNDGKEKSLSFEAKLDDFRISRFMYWAGVEAVGYGKDAAEARDNLSRCLSEIVEGLTKKEVTEETK